jgi:peptide/nickel transport system substrate-binding protein
VYLRGFVARGFIAALTAVAVALSAGAVGAVGRESSARVVRAGGTSGEPVTIAAEQELDCADWLASCAGSTWGIWSYAVHTLPRPFDQVAGKYVPNVLLKGEPKLDPGAPQKVTYEISDKAQWSDRQPITSHDFKYTWEQIVTGEDILDTTGYENIESIDDSNPKVAVVTFKRGEDYAAWRDLFGAPYGVLPSHILEGNDRNALMTDGYDWSGGPYIGKWTRGSDITLTANPNWYGPKPKINTVVFQFITETTAEAEAFKTGQVDAAYPSPQDGTAELFDVPGARHFVNARTTSLEGLFINTGRSPFQSKKVRQAIAYSLERNAIVKNLFGVLGVTKASQSLNFNLGDGSDGYYLPAFDRYRRDLEKVDELMRSDGWRKNSNGVWEKEGQTASFSLATTSGDARREKTQDILRSQLEQAGFEVETPYANEPSDTLFGETLPNGNYDIALVAPVFTFDPGLCFLLCSDNIPTEANEFSGQNVTRISSRALDRAWSGADTELNVERRNELIRDGQRALAEEVPAIPLDPLPDVGVWNGRKLRGPIGDNPTYGMFWNIHLWSVREG